MSFPSHIFKTYDIRGLAPGEITEELAYKIGRAFACHLRNENPKIVEKKLVVGHDMRPTSIGFQKEVVRGIIDEGISVVDVGLVSTPLFSFAATQYPEHAGGISVTASHNPAEYNGFKMARQSGLSVCQGNGMEEVRDLAEQNNFTNAKQKGSVTQKDIFPDYKQKIFSLVDKNTFRPLKVVVDFGNGMGSVTLAKLTPELPLQTTFLYEDLDGTFPNHEANPLKIETLRDLQKKVIEIKADLGFALDGDGDRIGLVDENGDVVDASFVGALVGLEVLRKHPGSRLLYDLRSSRIVPEVWGAAGATTEMTKVGYGNIRQSMVATHATFASELSLHLYFGDIGNVEISDLSLLYILQALSREKKSLSSLITPLKKYFHSGEINFEVTDKAKAIKAVEDTFAPHAKTISHLDGLWLEFDWGWLNVRLSNTEPLLRLNLEATTKEFMEEKLAEVKKVILG